MNKLYLITITTLGLLITISYGQPPAQRICATSRFEDQCDQFHRSNSEVLCTGVHDSIDCAIHIRNGTADFGVFTAESALQLASLGWDGLTVIKELRHIDRSGKHDFQSVVIVKVNHTNGIDGLRNLNYCHPGFVYDKSQRWTERVLKHFERTVAPPNCEDPMYEGMSPAEIEVAALARYFNSACRPGAWSNNFVEDEALKQKYPQLCALCNSDSNQCSYSHQTTTTGTMSSHEQALHCLTTGGGDVAYVSYEHADKFFYGVYKDIANQYAYLCSNGTLQPITSNINPCTWIDQPWRVVIANSLGAVDLSKRISMWLDSSNVGNWQTALREMITADSHILQNVADVQKPRDYFGAFRPVPVGTSLCSTQSTWCTTSLDEKEKCDVIRAAAITTGIYPILECKDPTTSVMDCLNDISASRADFMGIDSNFGYLARHPLNLTAALYAETESNKYASVVVIVHNNSTFERFENLRNSKACFPEFSGIASLAFINVGKNRGFLDKNECKYSTLLDDFFASSCLPGAQDLNHDQNQDNPDSLCSLCRTQVTIGPPPTITPPINLIPKVVGEDGLEENTEAPLAQLVEGSEDVVMSRTETRINCNADSTNRFYGTRGALQCLNEEGDVAVVELQYLQEHAINLGIDEHKFRILCRNGSLADRTGFSVDLDCALTTIVDGEVVVRRNSRKEAGIVNALLSLDKYFLIDPSFKMYHTYNGFQHLLFKDSSFGLISPKDSNLDPSIKNYIALFDNLENCTGASSTIYVNLFMGIFLLLITIIRIF